MNDSDLDDNLIDLDTVGDDSLYPGQQRSFKEKFSQFVSNKKILLPLVVLLIVILGVAIVIQIVIGVAIHSSGDDSNHETPINTIEDERALFWKNLSSTVHSSMDKSVDPCVDFYQYACGGWIRQTTIPPDKVAVEKSFSTVDDQNQIILNKIMTDKWPMIGTLYDNCMDQSTRNSLGGTPLIPFLETIKEVNRENLMTKLAEIHSYGLSGFFSFDVSPDLYDPELNRLEIDQGGTGLPTRDYYFSNSSFATETREAYKIRISSTLSLINSLVDFSSNSEASLPFDQQAENIFQFEALLAGASLSPVERRDLDSLSNIHTFEELSNDICPNLNWNEYFSTLGVPSGLTELNVVVPSFFEDLNEIIPSASIDLLQNYMRWHLARDTSKILSSDFFDTYFAYYQVLNGVDEAPAPSKICTGAVNSILGMLVGRYFVQETWSEESQVISEHLIGTIKQAFHENLLNITWMDQETLGEAFVKLAAVNDKVGHPIDSEWPNYSNLIIYPAKYFNNTLEGWKYDVKGMIAEAGQPVDKNKWEMYPQEVNAYYDPQLNEMVFPAAILQSPFFSQTFPTPMNYGGIGSVMGHELTHGFDDQGSEFDASGAFSQWWTDESYENFQHQTECVVNLYDNFQTDTGLYVNGEQTLGENIADMGGVKDAHSAMRKALLPGEAEDIQKYFEMTPDQLYFVSYGQVWCAVMHPEYEAYLLDVDVHSPPKARVNLPLSQYDAFGEVFSCKAGQPMNPQEKCSVW